MLGKLSVIIANYNYGRYIGAAIDSALALDWHDIEVIVVDDGSTDESRSVIDSYGKQIHAVYQANMSQRVARNVGFELSSGEAVIHLDSDDVLKPQLAKHLAVVWRPGISKVQVQMERIDENGKSLRSVFPRFRRAPSPQEIRRWAKVTTAYPTPPGSGNIYAREFLDAIFPLDESCGPATDSACLAVAPFLGDVVTIARPLVQYRVHGENASNLLRDPRRFANAVARARARYAYACRVVSPSSDYDERRLFRSRNLLQLRIASSVMTPALQPLPQDSRSRMAQDTLRSLFEPGAEMAPFRLALSLWCLTVLLVPRRIAIGLIRFRYRRT